ncbi:MAG: TonB-dependent receptor, partial [Candidatus Aminicenantes bacterium]|nr:TonB-dependent receptor [Candidatus Aminicenantes bacterium]
MAENCVARREFLSIKKRSIGVGSDSIPRSLCRWIPVLFLIFTLALFGASYTAEGTVRGNVVDTRTNEPLAGVRVEVVGLNIHTLTDKTGQYRLSGLPPGTRILRFLLTGYKEAFRRDVSVAPGKDAVVDIRLAPLDSGLHEEVTVVAEAAEPDAEPSATVMHLTPGEVLAIPGSVQDVSRVLNTNPGTAHASDLSNDLIVRGGSPWENGFYIDNMPVPDINHFQRQGSSGGLVSVIDPALLEKLTFYTGGFSASYGDRMSSVIEMYFREGDRNQTRTRLNLDAVGFGGCLEGPFFGQRGSWILSVRRNYHDLLAKAVGYGIAPRFGNANFKAVFDLDSRNSLTLMDVYGQSRLSYDLETAIEEGFNNFLNLKTDQNTVGLNWFSGWSATAFSNTSLTYSFFKNDYTVSDIDDGVEYLASDERHEAFCLRNASQIQLSPRARMEFGFEVKQEKIKFFNKLEEYINRWQDVIPAFILSGKMQTTKTGLFCSYAFAPLRGLTATLGLRGDYFSYSRRFHLSPRFTIAYKLDGGLTLKGGAGLYYQTLPLFLLSGGTANRENRDPRAHHFVLGLDWNLEADIRVALDVYHKRYVNMPLAPDDLTYFVMDSGIDYGFYRAYDVLYDSGTAAVSGVEMIAQKKLTRRFSGTVAASYFRSRFRDGYGVW